MTTSHDDEFGDALVVAFEELAREEDPALDAVVLQQLRRRLGLTTGPICFGRFELCGELGSGGMGVVVEAHDPRADRRVALKLLRLPSHRADARMREARALAKLSHPNVVTVYEAGVVDGQAYLTMELVRGQTLRAWSRERRPWREVCAVVLAAGRGLAAAHAAGIVHRDVKPDNVLLGDPVRVVDFGLAVGLGHQGGGGVDEEPRPTGTLAYMAPEQLRGEPLDARTDQFALCLMLYEGLTGERPFPVDSPRARLDAIERGVSSRRPAGAPRWLWALMRRGLEARPEQRHPELSTMLDVMEARMRGRGRSVGLVAVVVLVGASAGAWWITEDAARTVCSDPHQRLEHVWDPERRRATEEVFDRSELPYASVSWERVRDALDERVEAWVEAHGEACREAGGSPPRVPEIMDLRMECLRDQLAQIDGVVEVLSEADAEVLARSVDLVTSLPPVTRCREEAVRSDEPVLSGSPAVAREGEELGARLARARARIIVEDDDAALAELRAISGRIDALGHGPLVAEHRFFMGMVGADQGRYSEAREDLEHAYLLAVEHGRDHLAARIAHQLVLVVGYYLVEHDRGLWWGQQGLARLERVGEDPLVESALLVVIGEVLVEARRVDDARQTLQRALEIQRDAGIEPLVMAATHGELGHVLAAQGRLAEAEVEYREQARIVEEVLGPDHPRFASALNSMGLVRLDRGDAAGALEAHERARRIWERSLGPAHPDVGGIWANLGSAYQALHRFDEARASYERALAILEPALGAEHPWVAQVLVNLGNLDGTEGRLDSSGARLRRALGIMERTLGSEHPFVAQTRANLGTTQWRQGRLEDAVQSLESARERFERALGAEDPDLAHVLVVLAEVRLERGEHDEAQRLARRAVEILEEVGSLPREHAYAQFLLARVWWREPDRRTEARALAERAWAAYAALGSAHQQEAEQIEAWLDEPAATLRGPDGMPWFLP